MIVLLHLLFWCLHILREYAYWNPPFLYLLFALCFILVPFYVNYFLLVPAFFRRQKILDYFLWTVVTLSIFIGSLTWQQYIFYTCDMPNPLYPEVPYSFEFALGMAYNWCFLFVPASTGAKLIIIWLENQRKEQELILEKSTNELNIFKSEIDLPFILNSLSHTEKIALQNPKLAQEPTILLSDILRYSLYQSQVIFFKQELEMVENYIDLLNLQQSRFTIHLDKQQVISNLMVQSNLLFKHFRYWCEFQTAELHGDISIKISSTAHVELCLPKLNLEQHVDTIFSDLSLTVLNKERVTYHENKGEYIVAISVE